MEVNEQDLPPEGSTPKGLASSDDELTNTGNEISQCHNMDELHSNTERVNFKGETPSKGDACETPVVPEEREEGAATSAAVGTHRKELDPKRMKVVELRSELKARGLSTGVKTILAEKLQKSLDEEKQKESETPTKPKVVSCGNKRKLFSPKKILFSPNGPSDCLMPLVKSPIRKGRRSVPSPIRFDEVAGSEEADRAEIANSVANILSTLEDNSSDKLTDTGNEISQATAELKASQREFKSGPAAKKKKVLKEDEGLGDPGANGKEDTKDEPENWWKKTQHLHLQWLTNHDWGLTDIEQRGYYQPPPPPKKRQSSAKGKYFSGGLEDYRQLAVAAYRREESLRRRDGRHFMELRKDRT